MQIPIVRPELGEAEAFAVARVVRSGWVAQGPEVAAFECELASAIGAPQAVAVSSCTAALELCLRALGVGLDDDVVTVSHSFIATANAVVAVGARPVFVDIDPATYGMDARLLEAALTPKTRAILCVHQLGFACDLPAILEIASRRKIPVIEDAACAIGSEVQVADTWQAIGRPHGLAACFSFHPRKVITTGDGGMLTTANPEFDRKFRLWRQHSMSVSDAVRHKSSRVTFEEYPELGYNYRLTDIQAAVGREQLKRLPAIVARRRELAANYHRLLAGLPGVTLPAEPADARSNWQSYSLRLPAGIDQTAVMQFMLDRGIATRRGIMCSHREPAYQGGQYRAAGPLTESEAAQDRCIILPLFHQMTAQEQDRVVAGLAEAVFDARRASSKASFR